MGKEVGTKICSANGALVAGYGDEKFGTINSNIAAFSG